MRMAGEGASCLGGGRPGSGALPPPTARPLGGLPGPTTHWLWVWGGPGVGTLHQPHSALSCELALRAVGAARGRPGGSPPAWVWGLRGRALSHSRLPALWAGCRGPLPTGCGCGGVRAWGPVTNPTARALASWLCALWGRHEGALAGRLLPGCQTSGVGRSPTPDCPHSGRAAGAHYPLAVGAGGCGRGDPSPTPQRALLRAGIACCWGGMRVPGGGASCLDVGCPGSGALRPPTARLLGGLPGPTTHWLWVREGAGVGTRHQPHSARSCVLRGRHVGERGGRLLPGCGASGVGRSPTPDCPPSGRAARAHYPLAVGAGGCGRGDPSPTPQRALLGAGFARWGGGMRVPGGGASCLGVGRPGSGALPPPTARSLGGLPGPTTHWLWMRGGAGVGTRQQPHSARSCELALRAVGAARGRQGRAPPAWVWGLWGRALSNPDCPPSGRAAGAHYPLAVGAGGCGRGDPSPTAQRALLRAGFARCEGGTRAPGGGASCLGVGPPGSGDLRPPTARLLSGLPGATTHWLWVRGVAGMGTRHQPHSARSWELALRAVGAARGRPRGAPPAWVWGVRGRALSHPRLRALWAGCRGPLPTGCGCGGLRAWGPVTNLTVRALACCGGDMWVPGGGVFCLGVGRPGSGALPPPMARPLGGLPGPTTHWLWARRGAGLGTRHQPDSGRSGTPRPLVRARPDYIGDHGKRHPEPWHQPMTGVPAHITGRGRLPISGEPQLKPQG